MGIYRSSKNYLPNYFEKDEALILVEQAKYILKGKTNSLNFFEGFWIILLTKQLVYWKQLSTSSVITEKIRFIFGLSQFNEINKSVGQWSPFLHFRKESELFNYQNIFASNFFQNKISHWIKHRVLCKSFRNCKTANKIFIKWIKKKSIESLKSCKKLSTKFWFLFFHMLLINR